MKSKVTWNLRKMMAERGMFQTTELVPLLASHGVQLSKEQVYRLVTGTPQRLNMDVLAALCQIFECSPNDMIEIGIEVAPVARSVGANEHRSNNANLQEPVRARIQLPDGGIVG